MQQLYAVDQPDFFSIEAEVTEETLDRFSHQEAVTPIGPGIEITTLFRDKSYASIGEPIIFPLDQILAASNTKLPADVQLQRKEYDFYSVQLACSFKAASGCRFHDARFEFTLYNPDMPNLPASHHPLIYDLAPELVEDEQKVSRKYNINPDVKLDFTVAKAEGSTVGYEHLSEYMVYHGRIEADGLQGSKGGWTFTRTRQHEIGRSQRLFTIIRKPKKTRAIMQFGLAARVEAITNFGPIGPLPLTFIFHHKGNTPHNLSEPEVMIE
jgi:hypothetical protein